VRTAICIPRYIDFQINNLILTDAIPLSIGIYTVRHRGRERNARVGRDPDAMDGNIELRKPFFSYIKLFLSDFSHP